MKKSILVVCALALLSSCGMMGPSNPTLVSTSTYGRATVNQPVCAVFADLNVSPTKITYNYKPSKVVLDAGQDNVIASAVKEALEMNDDADVLVAMETQISYDKEGTITQVTLTGYPAKYYNFRNAGDEYLKSMGAAPAAAKGGEGKIKLPFGK